MYPKSTYLKFATVAFILMAILLSSFFVGQRNQNFQNESRADTPRIITPSVNQTVKIETASQISPDGTKKINMKKTNNSDGTSTYVFSVMEGAGEDGHELYTTKLQNSENLNISFNTWSPDNIYLFIQKNDSGAFVFKATGEAITGDQTYFDVEEIFRDKIKNAIPKKVTGWASPTLLIVNTVKEDNTKGPSYWFEVPSKAIVQLSSQF